MKKVVNKKNEDNLKVEMIYNAMADNICGYQSLSICLTPFLLSIRQILFVFAHFYERLKLLVKMLVWKNRFCAVEYYLIYIFLLECLGCFSDS